MASANLRKLGRTILLEYNLVRRQSAALIGSRTLADKSNSLKSDEDDEITDAPFKFTGSEAEAWRARATRSGSAEDMLWYQPFVISISLAVFMIYFFILREENDIDQIFDKSLYDHIEGLEEKQIEIALKFNQENGIPTKALEERLKEIRGY